MPASKPVVRTMERLRKEGWTAGVAEKYIRLPNWKPGDPGPPGIRRDLHGFVDVDAFHPVKGKLYVQACADTGGDVSAHVSKMMSPELVVEVSRAVRAGIVVEIHGWGMRGPRGKRKVWTRRRLRFVHNLDDSFNVEMAMRMECSAKDERYAERLEVIEMEGEVEP